jgi:hypothetical protein
MSRLQKGARKGVKRGRTRVVGRAVLVVSASTQADFDNGWSGTIERHVKGDLYSDDALVEVHLFDEDGEDRGIYRAFLGELVIGERPRARRVRS